MRGNADGLIGGNATWKEDYLSLDGIDDWVNFWGILTDAPITVETTIMINDNDLNGRVKYIIANVENGGVELIVDNGCFSWNVWDVNRSDYVRMRYNVKAKAGQKYHILATFNGECLELYIDGNQVATPKFTGQYGAPQKDTVMAMGVNPKGNGPHVELGYMNINIYSARIYNRVLTPKEIKQNFKASK